MRDGTYNGKVRSTFLGNEDHGIFVMQLLIDHSGGTQGFTRIIETKDCINDIREVLRVFKVERWEELVGKYCRVVIQGGCIRQVRHIVDDDCMTQFFWDGGEERSDVRRG